MELAKLNVKDLRISTKQSIEICNFIRNKNLLKAQKTLEKVLDKKVAVPFKKFNRDIGHKHGMASGSYPIKSTTTILSLLKSVQANAENKNMNVNSLFITKLIANKGSGQYHSGRLRRRKMKNTNIIIEVSELKEKKNDRKANNSKSS